jgi:hypothetical protein
MTTTDTSMHARVLCEKCSIYNIRDQEQMSRRILDVAKETNSSPDAVLELMLHRYAEYKQARKHLKWDYASAVKFLCWEYWDDASEWPWAERRFEPGLPEVKENKHLKEMDEWVKKYREEKGLAPL